MKLSAIAKRVAENKAKNERITNHFGLDKFKKEPKR